MKVDLGPGLAENEPNFLAATVCGDRSLARSIQPLCSGVLLRRPQRRMRSKRCGLSLHGGAAMRSLTLVRFVLAIVIIVVPLSLGSLVAQPGPVLPKIEMPPKAPPSE